MSEAPKYASAKDFGHLTILITENIFSIMCGAANMQILFFHSSDVFMHIMKNLHRIPVLFHYLKSW